MPDYKVVVYEKLLESPNGAVRERTKPAKCVDVAGPDPHCALVAAAQKIEAEDAGVRVMAPSSGEQETPSSGEQENSQG